MNPKIPQNHIQDLSKKEKEVLDLLLQGFSNRQIAATLQISEKAVEKHLTNIYRKAGVSSRLEAILWVREKGRDFPT
ncbi:MAG: LuxR C-terminal-related transcriptional regulator [Chloroflexota bacterium]